jgi:uncharacterized paraquat-inducible protein A
MSQHSGPRMHAPMDLRPAAGGAAAAQYATQARLVECHYCGQFEMLPSLVPGQSARCFRCGSLLRRARTDTLNRALALYFACASLFAIACLLSLMTVSTAGMTLSANLFSGPEGLGRNGLWELSVVVLGTTFAAPFAKLLCMVYVLVGLRLPHPPRHLRSVFTWAERLRPWSMIEVYLLGVFVAYTKLVSLVHIDVGDALYALVVLMLVTIAADAVLDRQAVWEEMERRGIPDAIIEHAAMARAKPGQHAIGWSAWLTAAPRCVAFAAGPDCTSANQTALRAPGRCFSQRSFYTSPPTSILYCRLYSWAAANPARYWAALRNCWPPACTRWRPWCSSPVSWCRC